MPLMMGILLAVMLSGVFGLFVWRAGVALRWEQFKVNVSTFHYRFHVRNVYTYAWLHRNTTR